MWDIHIIDYNSATKRNEELITSWMNLVNFILSAKKLLSRAWLFATPWTIALQAPLFM